MSMQEEFDYIIKLLAKANTEVTPSINEIMVKTLSFFNLLKEQLKTADEAKKKEIFALMSELKTKLSTELVKLQKKTGKTQEELISYLDDPEHFTPQQMEIIEATRKEVKEAASHIRGKPEKKPSNKKAKKSKKHKKGKWIGA